MSKLKYIETPPGAHFDEKEISFLQAIEGAIDKKAEELSKNIDPLYLKLDMMRMTRKEDKSYERDLNAKWIRAFVRGKEADLQNISSELKSAFPSHVLHTNEDGGYLVPELFLAEIQHFTEEHGIARRDMRLLPFGGPGSSRKIPTEASGIAVDWVNEEGLKPISKLTFGIVTQTLKKLAVISVITEELLEDSAVDLVAYVSRRIAEAISEEEDRVFFTGDTDAGDPFDGILNVAGTATYSLGATEGLSDLTAEDLLDMTYKLTKSQRAGGKYYMHSDVFNHLQKIRAAAVASGDSEGAFLIQQPTQGAPARLWGYEVVLLDVMPAADEITPEAPFIIFGNLARTCVYGEKQGMRVKLLTEATLTDGENTYSLAQQDAVAVRVFKRVGYLATLPAGICLLKAGDGS